MKHTLHLLASACLAFTLSSSAGGQEASSAPEPPRSVGEAPVAVDDGWKVATLEEEGIDVARIEDLMLAIADGEFGAIHSLLLARNGRLVCEQYFPGTRYFGGEVDFDRETLHFQASATKSFTSCLVGIAIGAGLIEGRDQELRSFFPDRDDVDWDDTKAAIEIEHLVSMTGGLYWDEWSYPYTDDRNTHVAMNKSEDVVGYALGLESVDEPGEKFVYNSALSILLGEIVHRASGLTVDEFARKHLFEPLGVEEFSWWAYPGGPHQTGGGLSLRPRDMAKFGQVYLDGGTWLGIRVVPEKWCRDSMTRQVRLGAGTENGYGYNWWIFEFETGEEKVKACAAMGWGGQAIFVVPSRALVVVVTGGNYDYAKDPVPGLIRDFVLPAVSAGRGDGAGD